MRKLLKIAAITVACLVLLVVAAAVIAPLVIKPNDYKDEIADLVRQRTGRELVFSGDIGVSVFPWLGLELGGLSLSNAPGFDQGPMLELSGMDVKVRLIPLLSRNIEVQAVRVQGLKAYLGKDKAGRTNWADLARAAEQGKAGAETAPEAAPDKGFAIASLAVGEVLVDHADLIWDDQQLGQYYHLSNLEAGTGPVSLGRPFDFHFTSDFESRQPAVKGRLTLTTHDEPAENYTRHLLKGTRLSLGATGEALPGGRLDADMASDILVDLAGRVIHLQDLRLTALGLDLAGDVLLSGFDTQPRARAVLSAKAFNPRQVMAGLGLTLPATADPKALTRAELSLDVTASQTEAEVKKLDMILDETRLAGKARAKDFAKPDLAFELAVDSLDLDRYLPPGPDKASAPDKAGAPAAAPKTQGKAGPGQDQDRVRSQDQDRVRSQIRDRLRSLVLDGALRVDSLKAWGVRLSDTMVKLTARNGLLRMEPFSTSLYGGALRSVAGLDLRTDQTLSALDLKLSGLALGSLLKDLLGQDKVTGQAALNLSLTARGEDLASVRKTLNGEAGFVLRDGAFKGFQIVPNTVREQAAAKSAQVKTATDAVREQQFRDIKASLKIKDGVVRNSDLALDADNLRATGAGLVDLAAGRIDYTVRADITGLPVIPFTIEGPLADPGASLDVTEFAKGLVESAIAAPEKTAKGIMDVGKGALEGIGQGLKGIFGGKKKDKK